MRGVQAHHADVDALLRKFSEHWALERMPAVDRAVFRLGAYELGWEPEMPTAVVISEAVELAKQYSTKDSGRFVNGLLSRIAEELRPSESSTVPRRSRSVSPRSRRRPRSDRPWIVIVWNDPVNLMSYVVYVFQKLFGYSKSKATKLMRQVHVEGRAVVSDGPRREV